MHDVQYAQVCNTYSPHASFNIQQSTYTSEGYKYHNLLNLCKLWINNIILFYEISNEDSYLQHSVNELANKMKKKPNYVVNAFVQTHK